MKGNCRYREIKPHLVVKLVLLRCLKLSKYATASLAPTPRTRGHHILLTILSVSSIASNSVVIMGELEYLMTAS